MRARAKRLPGQPGTKALLRIYGDRLVCVRYRYDSAKRRRYKTVELIVEEAAWQPPHAYAADATVHIQVAWGEGTIRQAIKQAGGRWNPKLRLWEIQYQHVQQLSLTDRIVESGLE